MFKKVFRFVFIASGILLGFGLCALVVSKNLNWLQGIDASSVWMVCAFIIFLFGLIFTQIYESISDRDKIKTDNSLANLFSSIPPEELIPGLGALLVALLIANTISNLLMGIDALSSFYLNVIFSIIIYLVSGYYSFSYGRLLGRVYFAKLNLKIPADFLKRKSKNRSNAVPKVLDTSVIIDGRIQEILRTGFIEGDIIIPDFVLVELRHISDSADELKRAKGRRGLDILNAIEEEFGIDIYDTSSDKDLKKYPEVDVKLLKLSQKLGGKLVTNDFNLNKVANVEGIGILNINDLANTLKPVSIPGEVMIVTPVRQGKNPDQSVAYLEDGTMIVVQGGVSYINKTIETYVTSVLQTSAGRMIFVKPKE